MVHLLLSAVLLAASLQNQPIRVGRIEFFGYAVVDLARGRAALPFREGDDLKWRSGSRRRRALDSQRGRRQAATLLTLSPPAATPRET
jgi:hypothetical protein